MTSCAQNWLSQISLQENLALDSVVFGTMSGRRTLWTSERMEPIDFKVCNTFNWTVGCQIWTFVEEWKLDELKVLESEVGKKNKVLDKWNEKWK